MGFVLDVDGLVTRYGETTALDGVTLAVEPGQVFGFVGRNGAGTTTTMRIILGVLAADAGEVTVAGPADRCPNAGSGTPVGAGLARSGWERRTPPRVERAVRAAALRARRRDL